MLRGVRVGACLTLALFLGALLFVHSQVPTPEHAGVAELVDRTLRGGLALAEVHLLDGRKAVIGARDLVALDPDLDSVGLTWARILAQDSPDLTVRERAAGLLIRRAGHNESELVDALLIGIRTGSTRLFVVAAERAAHLRTPDARKRIATVIARRGTARTQPAVLTTIVSALATTHLAPTNSAARDLFKIVLNRHRVDLLEGATAVALRLPTHERRDLAETLASDATIKWAGDASLPTLLAISMARTPFTLNQRGVYSTDDQERLAVFGQAHQLDPADSTIAANFATVAKTLSVERRDGTHLAEYDALLDEGLLTHPEVAPWRSARALTIPPVSVSFFVCGC